MLYDVTQIYDSWYRHRSCCPTSLELQCSRTTLHAKMYPHTDDTLQRRILYALCNRLYVVVQVQHGNRQHDKNQHVQAYPGTLRTWQMSGEVMLQCMNDRCPLVTLTEYQLYLTTHRYTNPLVRNLRNTHDS